MTWSTWRARCALVLATALTVAPITALAGPAQAADPAAPTSDTYASDLDWVSATNGWGPVERDRSNGEDRAGDGTAIRIDGTTYAKGLGVHASSAIRYDVGKNCETFVSDVGVDDEVWLGGSVIFTVVADGVVAAQTPVLKGSSKGARIEANIDGARYVDLIVSDGGDGIGQDHASWGGAKFECSGDRHAEPLGDLVAPTASAYASDLPWVSASNGWGPVEKDRSNGEDAAGDGGPLRVNVYTFAKGLGTHASSRIRYYTGGNCTTLTAKVGIDEEVGGGGSVNFRVIADGYQVYETGRLTGFSLTHSLKADIAGADFVELVVDDSGDGIGQDHADWGDAKLTCSPGPGLSFYSTPSSLPSGNGAIIRSEPSEFWISPLKLVKVDATVTRMMYRTTDRSGTPIAVTGQLLVPNTSWTGSGPRPVVAFAVGTQGVGDQCAPSVQTTVGTEYEAPFITGLVDRGYAVVITDYEGLGTQGMHTYMIRESQGHAVLDGVRAAFRLANTGLSASAPVAITGYSQGGGAAASALELEATYAPELNVVAGAAGGIPGDLTLVADQIDGNFAVGFLGYALHGITATYETNVATLLNDQGRAWLDRISTQCTVETLLTTAFTQTNTLTTTGQYVKEVIREPEWAGIIGEQLLGDARRPAVPTLVSHSQLDDIVAYQAGLGTAQRWCAQGAPVQFKPNLAPGHVGGALASYVDAQAFLADRFAGKAATSNCGTF
ncbi:NPCBM/NEW2 domain-containing protein [Intrasporangium calvum]|uniref:NPCBM/NEW2 domain-containing protein n=1 Tax=Intrasporangium calvum TaxID=53358 RepID=A0ABT5GFU1_9MICO|nr:NPCBM/NEW2 domain-containing protein [Intrasporangium calvum]MDC5696556.1 NPCBM/NEW2 domain-containing protein [Intrasporangium calvum]